MSLASLVVGMGSREAAHAALKHTRKFLAKRKADKAAARKRRAEKGADTYQPPSKTQPKKKPKKGQLDRIRERRQRTDESLNL
jgi:hypothetical protein